MTFGLARLNGVNPIVLMTLNLFTKIIGHEYRVHGSSDCTVNEMMVLLTVDF